MHDVTPPNNPLKPALIAGFTLIELSIVLVIIGLIVGGVLVGQDLIRAAEVRAQITQIEKYNTAVNTFRIKYNNDLPGDMNAADAAVFGFAARGQYAGEGDGNGILEGVWWDGAGDNGFEYQCFGETAMFWVDLSTAGLIEGSFNTATSTTASSCSAPGAYFPAAKLGGNNYINVYNDTTSPPQGASSANANYFSLESITGFGTGNTIDSTPGLTVAQAYAIDTKIDDGLPQSGNVVAAYLTGYQLLWAIGGGGDLNGYLQGTPAAGVNTSPVPASATTCYDNGNQWSTTRQYSMSQNGGAGVNCALSFRFQ